MRKNKNKYIKMYHKDKFLKDGKKLIGSMDSRLNHAKIGSFKLK